MYNHVGALTLTELLRSHVRSEFWIAKATIFRNCDFVGFGESAEWFSQSTVCKSGLSITF